VGRDATVRPGCDKELLVKKGRHRRFEEARSLKRSSTESTGKCVECGAEPDDVHASWCLAEEDKYDRILGSIPAPSYSDDDPLND
jgi:hypothetical protein